MKREKISEIIENIDSEYIDEAAEYQSSIKKHPQKNLYKWIVAAACFSLTFAISLPFIKNLFISPDYKDIVDKVTQIKYSNSVWEIIDDPNSIKKIGLKEDITEDIIGNHVSYLKKEAENTDYSDYIATDGETNTELLEYAPSPHKAVRIFRSGDKYFYALFCNYNITSNESLPIQEAFSVYGINKSTDIVCITPVKADNSLKKNGKIITDSTVIYKFFDEILKLSAFCFDDYHNLVFADKLKKVEGENGGDIGTEIYTDVADDRKDIVIETKDGLLLVIHYYPSYGWIYAGQTMSYYRMSPKMSEWFSNNIKLN